VKQETCRKKISMKQKDCERQYYIRREGSVHVVEGLVRKLEHLT